MEKKVFKKLAESFCNFLSTFEEMKGYDKKKEYDELVDKKRKQKLRSKEVILKTMHVPIV